MVVSLHRNDVRITGPLDGKSTAHKCFPSQRPRNTKSWCFIDVSLDKLLYKQSSFRWSETPWRSCDVIVMIPTLTIVKNLLTWRMIYLSKDFAV